MISLILFYFLIGPISKYSHIACACALVRACACVCYCSVAEERKAGRQYSIQILILSKKGVTAPDFQSVFILNIIDLLLGRYYYVANWNKKAVIISTDGTH